MTDQAAERVAFVGLGNMGWPMASQLVRAGFALAVVDAVMRRADGHPV